MPAVSTKKWFLKIYYKMLAVSTKKENTKIQFQNPKKNSLQISPIIYMRIMLVDFWTWKRVTERGVSLSLFARFKHSQRRARAFKIFLSLNLQIMIKMILYGPKQCCMIRAYHCAALNQPWAGMTFWLREREREMANSIPIFRERESKWKIPIQFSGTGTGMKIP